MAQESHEYGLNRRSFVTGVVSILGGIIAAIIGLPAIGYLLSPSLRTQGSRDEWVPLGSVDDLELNVPRLFSFTRTQQIGWERSAQSFGIYVVRKRDGSIDVFSNVCTHLSCRVTWKEDEKYYLCPCHDGHFALDGAILSGPQPRPLDEFEHRIEDGTLMIHLTTEA